MNLIHLLRDELRVLLSSAFHSFPICILTFSMRDALTFTDTYQTWTWWEEDRKTLETDSYHLWTHTHTQRHTRSLTHSLTPKPLHVEELLCLDCWSHWCIMGRLQQYDMSECVTVIFSRGNIGHTGHNIYWQRST